MSELEKKLKTLLNFAKENNFSSRFSQILFVEQRFVQHDPATNLNSIPWNFIFNLETYKKHFDDLLNQGHSWININLVGTVENSILVVIEYPSYRNEVPKEFVSVNFSLPEKRVIENAWEADDFYKIIY